ncbi:MAG: hypothetical protein R3E87_24540 [Burkholderiaceae bacterium]
MRSSDVPQHASTTLGGIRKSVYARRDDGRIIAVESAGWEPEETVTLQAVDVFNARTDDARRRLAAGETSSLEVWMHARRMDLATLSQSTGIWRWRVRRHIRPAAFARLSPMLLARYARALGTTPDALRRSP